MNKIPENKTRKRLRITLCVLYLFQLVFCAWPYYGFIQDGRLVTDSVYEMLSALGTGNIVGATSSDFSAINRILPLNFIFVIIPVIGFFFCAFDRERNLKNIVSLLCALAGVVEYPPPPRPRCWVKRFPCIPGITGISPIFRRFRAALFATRSNPTWYKSPARRRIDRSFPVTSKPIRKPSVHVSAILAMVSSSRLSR